MFRRHQIWVTAWSSKIKEEIKNKQAEGHSLQLIFRLCLSSFDTNLFRYKEELHDIRKTSNFDTITEKVIYSTKYQTLSTSIANHNCPYSHDWGWRKVIRARCTICKICLLLHVFTIAALQIQITSKTIASNICSNFLYNALSSKRINALFFLEVK